MTRKRNKKKLITNREISSEKTLEILFSDLIKQNNQIKLAELLTCETNIQILSNSNRHLDPYVLSVRAGHSDLIEFFYETKFFSLKQTSGSDEYCPAFIEAIKCSNEQALDVFLKLGVSVNSSDYKRQLPLQVAYNVYSLQKENSLYEADYDTDGLNKSFRIFKKLITEGSYPNIYNNKGYRLIHQIVIDKDLEALEFLLNSCQDLKINALTYGKMQNCLHLISQLRTRQNRNSTLLNWTTSGHLMTTLDLKLARLLVNFGCNIDHTDFQFFETPAFKAVVANYYELVKFFVIEGVNMSSRNRSGNDLLSRAIQLGRYKIARLLIAADSPIRVYSCVFKVPNIEELKNTYRSNLEIEEEDVYDEEVINNENFLQFSILKYEEFLAYLTRYTREPRSLIDLSRLVVRGCMKKPVSHWLHELRIPKEIEDILLLNNIENMI